MNAPRPDLQAHYGQSGLLEALDALLAECAGSGTGTAADEALARADEFHPGGRAATEQLARLAQLNPGARVLDLGCGIGGPARWLRRAVGPSGAVTAIDAVAEYCRAARALDERDPATADIVVEQADALVLDLPGPRFDLVWSQQAQMNVADKAGWLASVRRHLAPGGRYAFFETFAGPVDGPVYPVPWAATAAASHLVTPETWLELLAAAEFAPLLWLEHSGRTARWLDEAVAAQRELAAAGDPAARLSVRLLLGPDAATMSQNLRRNLGEGRLQVIMGVFVRDR